MAEVKERIEVKQVHDNDKYIITRTIVEEVNGQELNKIFGEISKAEEDMRNQVSDIPTQMEKRMAELNKSLGLLNERLEAFKPFADQIEKEEIIKANIE